MKTTDQNPWQPATGGEPKLHNVSSGKYLTNRKGAGICEGFQEGTCTELGPNNRCAKNSDNVHQCSKCLSPLHGAKDCNATPREPRAEKGAKAGGKGTGGGKGKDKSSKGKGKGKGKWW